MATTNYSRAREKGILGFDKSTSEYLTREDILGFVNPDAAQEIERLLLEYGDLRARLGIEMGWVNSRPIRRWVYTFGSIS